MEQKSKFATFSETENKVLTALKAAYKTAKNDGVLNYTIEYLRKETTNKQTSEVPVLLTNNATLKQLCNNIADICTTVFSVRSVKNFTLSIGGVKEVIEVEGVKDVIVKGAIKLHIDRTTFTIGKGKSPAPMTEGQIYNKFVQLCFASFDSEANLKDSEIFISYFLTCSFGKSLPYKFSVLKHAFDVSTLIDERNENNKAKQALLNVSFEIERKRLADSTAAIFEAVNTEIEILSAPAQLA